MPQDATSNNQHSNNEHLTTTIMKKIEFVGGISNELVDVIEENGIVATCIEGDVCEISDEDYDRLKEVAPAAFDGNDIITL